VHEAFDDTNVFLMIHGGLRVHMLAIM